MAKILITGSGSGLGQQLAIQLRQDGHRVYDFDIKNDCDVTQPSTAPDSLWNDLNDHGLDILINCAGINIINWLDQFEESDWDSVVNVNAKGIYMMSRQLLPFLKESKGTILNIVSNAAHIPMTCSLAYNASKGAAHIMTLQLARELTKEHNITVFGVAPNKLSGTGMSDDIDNQVVETRGWTKEYAQQYQLQGLLTGEETPTENLAEFITFLLSTKERHKYLTGTILPYGA